MRLISLFSKRQAGNANCRLGISLDNERIAIALAHKEAQNWQLKRCHVEPLGASVEQSLKSVIKAIKAPTCPTYIALALEDSRFHKIDKPQTPQDEWSASALFLLKDRLQQPIDDTLVACIEYPKSCRHDDHLMAIETQRSRMKSLVQAADAVGLPLENISVMELLLGDLFIQEEAMRKGIALLIEHELGLSLLLYRDQSLYMIRRLHDLPDLVSCLPVPGNVTMADNLMLEVQRTLDYYDAMMAQPTPAQLLIAPSIVDLTALAEHLDQNLAPEVRTLDLLQLFPNAEGLDSHNHNDLLGAICACMQEIPQ